MTMRCRGVRGATTVKVDTPDVIWEATRELLREVVKANGIDEEDVASVIFTSTPDLISAFPAKAARDLGWHQVALLGVQEVPVPDGIPMCIRILVHWNTEKSQRDLCHVYMHGAMALRPDLYPDNRLVLEEDN